MERTCSDGLLHDDPGLHKAAIRRERLAQICKRADVSWLSSTAIERVLDLEANTYEKHTDLRGDGSLEDSAHGAQPPAEKDPTSVATAPQPDWDTWRWPPQRGVRTFFSKLKGGRGRAEDIPSWQSVLTAFLGSFLSILAISGLSLLTQPRAGLTEAVPSFGASAVLIYGVRSMCKGPIHPSADIIAVMTYVFSLSLPCGQILSAVVGCAFRKAFGPNMFWLSASLAMSLSLTVMQLTRTTCPPGGAIAFFAATTPELAPDNGFRFMGGVVISVFVMLLIALLIDNLHPSRAYPKFWFGCRSPQSWWP